MAGRPKSIPREKRVRVFLDYRRLGKAKPTASLHAVARSTVTAIVQEFLEEGFSTKPRAKLSPALLQDLQAQHLEGMWPISVGTLDLGPGTDDEAGRQAAEADPLRVREEVAWHLKGTKAEQVIQEARTADRDFLARDRESWTELRLALEEACKLPEREGELPHDRGPRLLPTLKRRLRNVFFDTAHRFHPPPPGWLDWGVAQGDPSGLTLHKEYVAIGSPADHERVKRGVAAFLADGFREHQLRFREVQGLRADLGLMAGVVAKTVAGITKEEMGLGICPACPYPEGRADPERAQKPVEDKAPKTRKGFKR